MHGLHPESPSARRDLNLRTGTHRAWLIRGMKEESLSRNGVTPLIRPERPGQPHLRAIEINTGAMLASGASIGAVRLASDLIRAVWWPAQAPFSFDVDALSARLQEALPDRAWTPWRVRRYRAWALTFFRETGDGQWAPIPDYYRLPGRESARPIMPAKRA